MTLLLQGKWGHCPITPRWEEIRVSYLTSIDPWEKESWLLQGGDRSSPIPSRSPLTPPCISNSSWCVEIYLINDTSVRISIAASNRESNSMIWTIRMFVVMSTRILISSLRISLEAQECHQGSRFFLSSCYEIFSTLCLYYVVATGPGIISTFQGRTKGEK